jgi:hypothetical protein
MKIFICTFKTIANNTQLSSALGDMKHLLLTTIAAVVLVGCGSNISIHETASSIMSMKWFRKKARRP